MQHFGNKKSVAESNTPTSCPTSSPENKNGQSTLGKPIQWVSDFWCNYRVYIIQLAVIKVGLATKQGYLFDIKLLPDVISLKFQDAVALAYVHIPLIRFNI